MILILFFVFLAVIYFGKVFSTAVYHSKSDIYYSDNRISNKVITGELPKKKSYIYDRENNYYIEE